MNAFVREIQRLIEDELDREHEVRGGNRLPAGQAQEIVNQRMEEFAQYLFDKFAQGE